MKAEVLLAFPGTFSYFTSIRSKDILVVLASSVAWHSLCLTWVCTIDIQ